MAIKYDNKEQKLLHKLMARDAGYIKRTVEDILKSTKSHDSPERHAGYTAGAVIIHLTSHILSDIIHGISEVRKGNMDWDKAQKLIVIRLEDNIKAMDVKTSEIKYLVH